MSVSKQSTAEVLVWIKKQMGHPYTVIELSDKDIVKDIILDEALEIFSTFYPRTDTVGIVPNNEESKIKDTYYDILTHNTFKVYNDNFIGVASIYDGSGCEVNYEEIERDTYRVGVVNRLSVNSQPTESAYHGKFVDNGLILKMKLQHASPKTIPTRLMKKFRDLCLFLYAKRVTVIRKNTQNMQTTVGTIDLNNDRVDELVSTYDEWFDKELNNIKVNGTKRMLRFG